MNALSEQLITVRMPRLCDTIQCGEVAKVNRWPRPILIAAWLLLGCTAQGMCPVPLYYERTKDGWFYARKKVSGADLATFHVLSGHDPYITGMPCVHDSGYAVDRFRAYWGADALPEADPKTFSFFPGGYARDAAHVYYRTSILSGADVRSFTYIGSTFFKDSRHVYLNGAAIQDADPATFEPLGDSSNSFPGLARDATHVFFGDLMVPGGHAIVGANPKDAIPLGNRYWKSNGQVFFRDKPLMQADAATFHVAESTELAFFGEDSTYYFRGAHAFDRRECRKEGILVLACRGFVLAAGRKYSQLDSTSLHYLGMFPHKCGVIEGSLIYQDKNGIYTVDGDGLIGKFVDMKGHQRFDRLDKALEDRLCSLDGTEWVINDGGILHREEE